MTDERRLEIIKKVLSDLREDMSQAADGFPEYQGMGLCYYFIDALTIDELHDCKSAFSFENAVELKYVLGYKSIPKEFLGKSGYWWGQTKKGDRARYDFMVKQLKRFEI